MTVRDRMTTAPDIPLQDLPRSGNQSTSSLHTIPVPTPPLGETHHAEDTQPSTLTAAQSVVHETPQATGSSPTPGSPGPSQAGSTQTIESSQKKWTERLKSPVGWRSIVIGVIGLIFMITAWRLQVWSARNEYRASCWTDWDHKVYSKRCNDTLAHPATPPPSKRAEVLQERNTSDFRCSYIALLVTAAALIFALVVLSQDLAETAWSDYYSRIKSRFPLSRPTWLVSIPTARLAWVVMSIGIVILNFVESYTRMLIVLAIGAILVCSPLANKGITTLRAPFETAFTAVV